MAEKEDPEKTEPNYDEAVGKAEDIMRALALSEIKDWFNKLPQERKDSPVMGTDTRTFTPRQIVEEVENDTEYGKIFAKMLHEVRIELAKKENR